MKTSNKLPNQPQVDYKLNNESGWPNLKGINKPDFNYLPNDLIGEPSSQPCLINQVAKECIEGRQKKTLAEITSKVSQYCKTKKG